LSVERGISLGEQLLPAFCSSSAHLSQVFAGVGPQCWDAICYHPGALVPAWILVDFRLTEVVMHGWDIRSRFDPTASLLPESVPAFLGVLAAAMGWIFWPGPRPAAPVRYRFAVTDPVPTPLDVVVTDTQAQVEHGSTAQADVTFQCSADTLVFIMYGRLTPQAALAQGRLQADGAAELVTAFAQWFRGV
jgi:predicted lipid carrier protein YhbT